MTNKSSRGQASIGCLVVLAGAMGLAGVLGLGGAALYDWATESKLEKRLKRWPDNTDKIIDCYRQPVDDVIPVIRARRPRKLYFYSNKPVNKGKGYRIFTTNSKGRATDFFLAPERAGQDRDKLIGEGCKGIKHPEYRQEKVTVWKDLEEGQQPYISGMEWKEKRDGKIVSDHYYEIHLPENYRFGNKKD